MKKIKVYMSVAGIVSYCVFPVVLAQQVTEAEINQARAAYSVETLKSDALCGEASLLWQGNGFAIQKGMVGDVREIVDKPPKGNSQLGSYKAKSDIQVNGMRVVGIDAGIDKVSVKLNFDKPPKEVFANLPGKPIMQMTQDLPDYGLQIWTEKKPEPKIGSNERRLWATSYRDQHTQVACERSYNFSSNRTKK